MRGGGLRLAVLCALFVFLIHLGAPFGRAPFGKVGVSGRSVVDGGVWAVCG